MSPTTTDPPLVADGLTVRYGAKTAVAQVSLAVERGKVYALLGRNGAGKTSLVRCLLGHRRPDGGCALLFGEDVWSRRARLLRQVGVVPEQPDAPPAMSARALGRFSAVLYPDWDAGAYRARLRRSQIPDRAPFGQLSKGQKGQVALSLALASRPRLLVLDDPTLGLDAVARQSIYDELIDELAERGTTVFLTTHDLAGIEGIADRIGILEEGRLALDEPLESLKSRFRRISVRQPSDGGRREWIDRVRPLAVASHAWGVEAVVSDWDESALAGLVAVPAEPVPQVSALTLEEIFVALAGSGGGER